MNKFQTIINIEILPYSGELNKIYDLILLVESYNNPILQVSHNLKLQYIESDFIVKIKGDSE
jgi:hypothetical protein